MVKGMGDNDGHVMLMGTWITQHDLQIASMLLMLLLLVSKQS